MLLSKEEKIVKDGVGVIVGRFQPLTEGHRDIIESVIARHHKTIIVVGNSPIRFTAKNPLDYELRRRVLQKNYPDVQIIYQNDHPSNEAWSKKLDKQICSNVPPTSTVILYGSRDNFSSRYSGKFKVVELIQDRYISGSIERERASYITSDHEEFINGMICSAQNQFPTAFCAVDVAIIDSKYNRLLLGRKENQSKFQFVGGFVEPSTDALEGNFLEINAKREVMEETCLEVDNLTYNGSFLIDDWRYRGEVNKIFSAFFIADYVFGKAEPKDDMPYLYWFDLDKINEHDVIKEHRFLMNKLLSTLNSGGK